MSACPAAPSPAARTPRCAGPARPRPPLRACCGAPPPPPRGGLAHQTSTRHCSLPRTRRRCCHQTAVLTACLPGPWSCSFEAFLKKGPQGVIDQNDIRFIDAKTAVDSGVCE